MLAAFCPLYLIASLTEPSPARYQRCLGVVSSWVHTAAGGEVGGVWGCAELRVHFWSWGSSRSSATSLAPGFFPLESWAVSPVGWWRWLEGQQAMPETHSVGTSSCTWETPWLEKVLNALLLLGPDRSHGLISCGAGKS